MTDFRKAFVLTRTQANLLLLAVALVWGSAFVAQAQGMDGVSPFTFTGVRFLLGVCVVAPLAWRDWREVSRRPGYDAGGARRDALGIATLGLLLALGAAFQQIGILSTTVTNAGFLTALYVPLVPMVSWLILRDRPHWSVWPTSVGCLVGTWMLSGAGGVSLNVGDAWVILSSLFWALHVFFVGRIAERIAAPFLVACGQFFVCGVICLLWAGFTETITLAGIREAAWPIVYTGVVSVGFAYTGQVVGQRYAAAADAAVIMSAETLFAALFGFLLMGDRLTSIGVAGGALIFVCVIAVQMMPLITRPAAALEAD